MKTNASGGTVTCLTRSGGYVIDSMKFLSGAELEELLGGVYDVTMIKVTDRLVYYVCGTATKEDLSLVMERNGQA